MATPLETRGIYFIESDAGDNQDWVAATGDPEDIDLDNFNEGTDYCYFEIVASFSEKLKNKWNKTPFPNASSFVAPMEEREEKFGFEADFTNDNRSKINKIKEFWIKHTNISDNGYYVIVKYNTDDYEPFWDDSRAEKKYCKGKFDYDRDWDGEDLLNILKIKFFDVWDD